MFKFLKTFRTGLQTRPAMPKVLRFGRKPMFKFLKRFGRGCKPRPAMPKVLRFGRKPQYISLNIELNHAENSTQYQFNTQVCNQDLSWGWIKPVIPPLMVRDHPQLTSVLLQHEVFSHQE